jgi:putative redox protein
MLEVSLETEQYWAGLQAGLDEQTVVVTDSGQKPWGQVLLTRDQVVFADEPAALGGQNNGPTPTHLVLMALGACTAITTRMYAARKEWTIERIAVRLRWTPEFTNIERHIEIEGPLDEDQRARLLQIAEKCPVHKILSGGVAVQSELAPAS